MQIQTYVHYTHIYTIHIHIYVIYHDFVYMANLLYSIQHLQIYLFSYLKVGVFKCIVRVMESEDEEPLFKGELMESLLKPKKYKVRLYVLRALKLTPMDIGLDGKPSKSDPYLRVKLGKSTFDDREHAIDNAVDVDLYKCIEFDAELPGTSQLIIDVMDKDDFGPYSDDLIGRTIMDLEDRWFDARWQELGQENRRLPAAVGTSSEEASKPRWCTKPIETRSIYVPSNKAPQVRILNISISISINLSYEYINISPSTFIHNDTHIYIYININIHIHTYITHFYIL